MSDFLKTQISAVLQHGVLLDDQSRAVAGLITGSRNITDGLAPSWQSNAGRANGAGAEFWAQDGTVQGKDALERHSLGITDIGRRQLAHGEHTNTIMAAMTGDAM